MKNSKTTLMELTREYRSILKKCFLLNLGIVLFTTAANAGITPTVDTSGDLYKYFGGQMADVDTLTLTSPNPSKPSKMTLNKPTFYVPDEAGMMFSVTDLETKQEFWMTDLFSQFDFNASESDQLKSWKKVYKDGYSLVRIDNQMGGLIIDGAQLSTNKMLYASAIGLDNGGAFTSTAKFFTNHITVNHGSHLALNNMFSTDQIPYVNVQNDSTFELSNVKGNPLSYINISDSDWTAKNTILPYLSQLSVSRDSSNNHSVNLTGSQIFADVLSIFNNDMDPEGLSVTLNNGTILSGHSRIALSAPSIAHVDMVLNNSTIGNQPIGYEIGPHYIRQLYSKDGADETFDIQNSVITLKGNSSIKNSLLIQEGDPSKPVYQEMSPLNLHEIARNIYAKAYGINEKDVNESNIDEVINDSGLRDFDNEIRIHNHSFVTMDGTSSIINNSLDTGHSEQINIFDNSTLEVLGKNNLISSGEIWIKNSTLDLTKGATLNVKNAYDWGVMDYTDNTINLTNANLVLAGTLNANLMGSVSSLTLAPTFKIDPKKYTIDLAGGDVSGFGLSGVNNVKDGNKMFQMFYDLTNDDHLNTLILDNSKLSATMLDQIEHPNIGTALGLPGSLTVQNKSTLTVDDVNWGLDLSAGSGMEVIDSTVNVQKNASMDVSDLQVHGSTLTFTGDAENDYDNGGTGMSATSFTMTNSTLNLTNANIEVDDDIYLINTGVKMTGSDKNITRTAMFTNGGIYIDNNEAPKATVTLTGAHLAANDDITVEGTSFTFNGDKKLYEGMDPNYISANYFDVVNYNETPNLTATFSKGEILANQVHIRDIAKVKWENMLIFDQTSSANNTSSINNAETVDISNSYAGGEVYVMNAQKSVTVKNSAITYLDISGSSPQKATISNSTFGRLNVEGNQATISNSSIDSTAWIDGEANLDSKQKVVYSTNATMTNTQITGNSDFIVRGSYLTIGKGNDSKGCLFLNGQGDLGAQEAYVLVKDDFRTNTVFARQGTLEVAANKTLTATNGITMDGDDTVLLLKGKTMGNVTFNGAGTIVLADNKAQFMDNASSINFGTKGNLEFRNVKGSLSGFVPLNNTLDLRNVTLTNSTLTYDRNENYIAGNLNIKGSKLYLGDHDLTVDGEVNIYDKSTIYTDITKTGYGSLIANTFNLQTKADKSPVDITLAVTIQKDAEITPGTKFKFLDYNPNSDTITGTFGKVTIANNRYTFREDEVGQFTVTNVTSGKGVIERTQNYNQGVLSAATALVDAQTAFADPRQAALSEGLNRLSQVVGGEKAYAQALSATNPDDDGIVHTTALTAATTSLNTMAARMTAGSVSGISGGDLSTSKGAMWAKAIYNHTQLDNTAKYEGFKANSKGIAVGIETNLTEAIKAGIGYAYTRNDVKAFQRSLDVDSHTLSLYGEYKPNNWFIDGVLGLGWSDYDGAAWSILGTNKSGFEVYSYSAQGMTGYEWNLNDTTKIVPFAGLRYVRLDQRDYNDDDGKYVTSDANNTLTGLVGAKTSWNFTSENGTSFKPDLHLGMSYDFKTDGNKSTVSLSNGSSYEVEGRRLRKLGITGGIGAQITKGDFDLLLGYDCEVRKDYNTHTGSIKLKYHF